MSRLADTFTIRPAQSDDEPRLLRLAALDSGRPPKGATLVAEADGCLLAAVSLGGRAIADPFVESRDVVELLRLRAEQLGAPSGCAPR